MQTLRGWLAGAAGAMCFVLVGIVLPALGDEFDLRQRAAIQDALIWVAGYDGMIDGEFGDGTQAAVRNFQRANGYSGDGELTHDQAQRLLHTADEARRRAGFTIIADDRAGVSIGLPTAFVIRSRATRRGNTYSSSDGAVEVDTLAFSEKEVRFADLFRQIAERGAIRNVNYSMLRDHKFVVSGDDGAKHHYFLALRTAGAIRAFSLSFPIGMDLHAVTVAMANSFRIGATGARFAAPSGPQRLPDSRAPASADSAFVNRSRLLAVVDGFLSDAGITAYKVLPPDPGSNDPHLRWAYEDGAMGELMALRPGAGMKLEDLANYSIEREAKACKGEFATARLQSRFFKGSEVQRVETRCRSSAGLYAVNFSIIELPSGAILRFGSLVPATGPSDAMGERTTHVENAAMVYVGTKGLE